MEKGPGELHVFYFSGRSGHWKTKPNCYILGKCDLERRFYNPWAEKDWEKLRHSDKTKHVTIIFENPEI